MAISSRIKDIMGNKLTRGGRDESVRMACPDVFFSLGSVYMAAGLMKFFCSTAINHYFKPILVDKHFNFAPFTQTVYKTENYRSSSFIQRIR